ncbi:MAG: hypothetical protein CME06_04165 [Gemmatimonadetes bacterium]|nr:hypothetical protein [Gemmatimonadota bacterium]
MNLSIIIVAHNSSNQIAACVRSITPLPGGAEIIVLDNGSADDTAAQVRPLAGCRLILSHQNLGFAKAANRAAVSATGRYLLFLNPDLQFTDGSPADLIEFAQARPRLGALTPMLLDPAGRTQFSGGRFPSLLGAIHALYPWRGHRRVIPTGEGEVDWILGAAMLLPAQLFRSIGGFDEKYFLYGEDKDLCRRIRDRGRTVHLTDSVRALHLGGGSGGRPAHLGRYFYRAQARYLSKFHRPLHRAIHALLLMTSAATKIAASAPLAAFPTRGRDARRRIAFHWGATPDGWSLSCPTGPIQTRSGQ